jgi:hypothetical protein
MYKSSPIFDVPEFPPLRRVKPLPKRRRTSDLVSRELMAGPLLGPNATPEELIAQADQFSSRMGSYYLPLFSGLSEGTSPASGADPPLDFGLIGGGRDDEEQGEGDYVDHLQQPGNTKKRKVPPHALPPASGADADSAFVW